MNIQTITTTPFSDQNPGTSGLRKKVAVFQQPHYLENFLQALFLAVPNLKNGLLIIGGDGRFYNPIAQQIALKMAAANGVARVIIGQNGLLSTPAISHLIRMHKAHGGIIFSASHNPGGPQGDFGVKFNNENGSPAPEQITKQIFAHTKTLQHYQILQHENLALDQIGEWMLGDMLVSVIDPVVDYCNMLEEIFDFDSIRQLFANGFRMQFDALSAITGPYAVELFENRCGAPKDTVLNFTPMPDFGGHHPDPNGVTCADFVASVAQQSLDLGAASDGDGDRHMIVSASGVLPPSDNLALLTLHASCIPTYRDRFVGVARSMPTSRAVDAVAEFKGFPCYEVPTGWKFFGNLLDADKITFCGEESFAASSNHIREKDGLWAVMCWLSILAAQKTSVDALLLRMWRQFGRFYYTRHDFENIPAEQATAIFQHLRSQLTSFVGSCYEGIQIQRAEEFTYHDPVDGSMSAEQGICLFVAGEGRVVYRLSGTGTQGSTIRIYLEQRITCNQNFSTVGEYPPIQQELARLAKLAVTCGDFAKWIGRTEPDIKM